MTTKAAGAFFFCFVLDLFCCGGVLVKAVASSQKSNRAPCTNSPGANIQIQRPFPGGFLEQQVERKLGKLCLS